MREQSSRYGGMFEDFRPGQVFKHWPGKTITESDNNLFSLLTRNDNPLHSDAHYLESHQHGRILVNGDAGVQPSGGDERPRHQRAGRGEPGIRAGDARRGRCSLGIPSTPRRRCWKRGKPARAIEGLCTSRAGGSTNGGSGS